jgi:hypothetical protein
MPNSSSESTHRLIIGSSDRALRLRWAEAGMSWVNEAPHRSTLSLGVIM